MRTSGCKMFGTTERLFASMPNKTMLNAIIHLLNKTGVVCSKHVPSKTPQYCFQRRFKALQARLLTVRFYHKFIIMLLYSNIFDCLNVSLRGDGDGAPRVVFRYCRVLRIVGAWNMFKSINARRRRTCCDQCQLTTYFSLPCYRESCDITNTNRWR